MNQDERVYLEESRRGLIAQIRGLQQQLAAVEKRLGIKTCSSTVESSRTTASRS